MSFRVSKQEPGFVLSALTHVVILVVGLLGLADAKKFEDAQEALPVEILTESQLKQITQGDKSAKQVIPDAKLRVDRVSPEKKQDEPGEKKPELAVPLAPPPLPPVRPVDVAKAEPEKVKPEAKPEAREPPPPPKQIALLPPVRPVEPLRNEPLKKAASAPFDQEDEEDPEAEVIKQAAKKSPLPKKEDVQKSDNKPDPLLKILEQQKAEDARKKAEEAKKQAEQKRLADARQADEERKAEEAEQAEAAKKAAESKKLAETKKLAEAKKQEEADKAEEAKEAVEEAKKATDAKAKAAADAKKKELAAKAAASEAEAKRRADFDKSMRAKLASAASNPSNGGNGQQTPTDRVSSATGSTGAQVNRNPTGLGAPTANGQKLSPAQREGLEGMLRSQIEKCWSVDPASKPNPLPIVRMQLNPDGTLAGRPQLVNSSSDPVFQSVASSGIRAIQQCAPYKIPSNFAGFFNDWKTSAITLDPRNAQ